MTADETPVTLLPQWLKARSWARGLPQPTPEHGGWRVETGTVSEPRRYVFAEPCPGIAEAAAAIADPNIPIKLCADPGVLARLVPAGWTVEPSGTMMIRQPEDDAQVELPPGFRLERMGSGACGSVTIRAPDDSLAASGYCGWTETHFCFDRIITQPEWQRRGLGRAVMRALGQVAAAQARTWILIATDAGRALYLTLGWRDISPYSTATKG